MSDWKGQSKGMPIGYKIFVFLMRYLGLYPAYFLLLFVAFHFFHFSRESTFHIRNFYRKRMRFSPLKSRLYVYKNYFLFGQTLLDKVAVMAGFSDKLQAESFGKEHILEIIKRGKGGFLIGAHVGNWEIAGKYVVNYSAKVKVLMYENEHAKIKDYLDNVTGGRNYEVIPIKTDLSHIYAISEALQTGHLICMHADRFLPGNKTILVDFFGEKARFPVGAFQLLKTFKCPYTFVYGMKVGLTKYHFSSTPIREAERGSSLENMVQDYATHLETMTRKYPAQWFNYFDFWGK